MFTPDDILFMVFRRKWLLLFFVCLGVAGAVAARVMRPPLAVSKAKLMIHYVLEPRPVNPASADSQEVHPTGDGPQAIVWTEIDILTSRDVVTNTVAMVGAEKILACFGAGTNPKAAAGVVASGIEVEPPHSSVLTVTFKHRDPEVAQLVLSALLETYQKKHMEVYQGRLDDYYAQQRDESRHKLVKLEEDLKSLKSQANVLYLEDPKQTYQTQIEKKMEEVWDAERDLAERKAVLGVVAPQSTASETVPAAGLTVPPQKLNEYSELVTELDNLKKEERELLRVYTKVSPLVQPVEAQVEKLSSQRAEMERAFPGLTQVASSSSRPGTNGVGVDVTSEWTEVKRLTARLLALRTVLSNLQASATQAIELDPKVAELQRQHDEEQKRYEFFLASLEETRRNESRVAGRANNISMVQNPTPAGVDYKKTMKLVGAVLAGCVGLGLALAFLLEQVLDRSIKRVVDIERRLHLPVFLSIPDTAWQKRRSLPWRANGRGGQSGVESAASSLSGNGALVLWQPSPELRACAEGLRERLMTYFEVNDLGLKKPKLVAVTGCDKGSEVSALAGSLAATLSEVGEGNVLLVNMNVDNGVAQPFRGGKPGPGLAEVLEPEHRADAQVQEHLYLASLQDNGTNGKLTSALSKQFNHLVPKLKASDYDYIIFDMPPVAPNSVTARLAGHMDITLLVLEAEQTTQQAAARATSLMRQSKANVATVLNKRRQHVPATWAQE
jgi:polysaccharide biosynthesis transport protein